MELLNLAVTLTIPVLAAVAGYCMGRAQHHRWLSEGFEIMAARAPSDRTADDVHRSAMLAFADTYPKRTGVLDQP